MRSKRLIAAVVIDAFLVLFEWRQSLLQKTNG